MISSMIGLLALPHELLHYIAARGLGVEAYIQGNVTWVHKTTRWKSAAISLAPIFPGVLMLGFCIWKASQPGANLVLWFLLGSAAVAWLLGCALDFRDVWRLLCNR